MSKVLTSLTRLLVFIFVILTTGFALYTGGTGPFDTSLQRGLFLLLMMPLVFLYVPSGITRNESVENIITLIAVAVSLAVFTWNVVHYERLYSDPFLNDSDILVGILGLILVLEAVRRTVGLSITLIFCVFIAYALVGPEMPVTQLRHGGLTVEDVASQIFFGTDGVFGTPVGVAATFIVIIVMLGGVLNATGGAELFMNLANGIAGRFVGGPAKIAVCGSAMMGMITGATVANVATTGSVTIPMMKRAGYGKNFSGAVEALASSGGQLMPPIMGAAAFVMIDYLNMDYLELIKHAIIPSMLYFFSVLMVVHVRSVKNGFGRLDSSERPSVLGELKARGHMLLPIVLLVVLLSQHYGIMYVAFLSVVCALVLSLARKDTRLNLKGYYEAFDASMRAMAPLVAICAGAGILIGVLTATGLNLKITTLIELLSGGNLFLVLFFTMIACIILGMGLPTVAAYVVLATLVPGAMINLGVPPIAAHLFIFYFAILSAITPPVCTGAYVAAGISGGDPVKTGLIAIKLGLVVFLLPYAFVYNPSLLLIGSPLEILTHIGTAVIGIAYWSWGLEGHFTQQLSWPLRLVLIVSGVLLMWPIAYISAIGLLLGTPVIVWKFMLRNRVALS